MPHQFLTICSQVRLSRELQWKVSREWSNQQITFLVVQSVDKQLVVLEQGSCDKLRTQEVGSKDAVLLVGHVPQRSVYCMDLRPLLTFTSWPNISPTSRHRTNDKNALINMILSMGPIWRNLYSISWRESPDTSTVCNNEDKRNHPHHLFSHCVS